MKGGYSHYRAGVAPYLALAAEGVEMTPGEQKLMRRVEVQSGRDILSHHIVVVHTKE